MRLRALVALAVVLAACSSPKGTAGSTTTTVASGAGTPEGAVQDLLDALAATRFDAAAAITVPGQMPVVALAEGASPQEVVAATAEGDSGIGENFWKSFDDNLKRFLDYGPGDIRTGNVSTFEVDGVSFAMVDVSVPVEGATRHFVTRDDGGWRVDVLVTFADALVEKIADAADAIRTSTAPQAASLREALKRQEASFRAVLQQPDVTPAVSQAVIRIVTDIGGG